MNEYEKSLQPFLYTKAGPRLYWAPKEPNDAIAKRLAECKVSNHISFIIYPVYLASCP
jgi:hypothetical protein